MTDSLKNKLFLVNSIIGWVALFGLVLWLVFKPADTLNKETVDKLTVAVDNFSKASENMKDVANAQRGWSNALNKAVLLSEQNRNKGYGDLYAKYGDDEASDTSLNDLYARQLHVTAESDGGRDVRRDEDGASKTGTPEKPVSKPQGQSN